VVTATAAVETTQRMTNRTKIPSRMAYYN